MYNNGSKHHFCVLEGSQRALSWRAQVAHSAACAGWFSCHGHGICKFDISFPSLVLDGVFNNILWNICLSFCFNQGTLWPKQLVNEALKLALGYSSVVGAGTVAYTLLPRWRRGGGIGRERELTCLLESKSLPPVTFLLILPEQCTN